MSSTSRYPRSGIAAIALGAALAACQPASNPSPSPSASAGPTSPASAAATTTLPPTIGPVTTPGESSSASALPTAPSTAYPTVVPTAPPSAPPTAVPSQAPVTLGDWVRVTDFPLGGGDFVRLRAATHSVPGYVAVGFVGDGAGAIEAGRVWMSDDGRTWSVQPSDAFQGARLEIVVEHLGTLYALGPIPTDDPDFPDVGAYNIWSSSDGVNWTRMTQPPAFTGDAVLLGATSAGETLIAFGYRNLPDAVNRPAVWTWTPTAAGSQWQLADTLPDTYDVRRLAYADDIAIALGNAVGDGTPSRSIWHSTEEGRSWAATDAPYTLEAGVHLQDIAANVDPARAHSPRGIYVAVGAEVRDMEVWPVALPTTYTRDWFDGGRLLDFPMHQMERLVAVPGGFLAFGSEMRYVVDPNCAPGPCEGLEPLAGAAWTSADGLTWRSAPALPRGVAWEFAGIAVGATGVVVTDGDRVWSASLDESP